MTDETPVFRALADETRRRILDLLSGGHRPVGELAAEFPDISRPAVSKHLRILRQAGLVAETREGRQRLYRLVRASLQPAAGWLNALEGGLGEPPAGRRRRRRVERVAIRPRAGVRPLDRDEPGEPDWRSW